MDRKAVEQLAGFDAFRATIETATTGGDGKRRVSGVANTFSVMRSGRIIHPAAVEDWLRNAGQVRLPLMAQHGFVPGFATIGVVDSLTVDRKRGLLFSATIASGTELSEDAWALIQQGLLGNLSVGWTPKQARWVKRDDKDIDPWLAGAMDAEGVTECYAHLAVELVEISVVDVGDDRSAKLAAEWGAELMRRRQGTDTPAGQVAGDAGDAIAELRREVAALRRDLADVAALGAPEAAAIAKTLRGLFSEFVDKFTAAAGETLASDAVLDPLAAELDGADLDDDLDDLGGDADTEDDLDAARSMLDRMRV